MKTKLTKDNLPSIIACIENHKKEIAKHRDALRKIYDDIEDVCSSFDQGIEELDCAIDTLSEQV